MQISKGEHGELSKIHEELMELTDAHMQDYPAFVAVEASDLINSVGRFTWRKYRIPLFLLVILYYIRLLYKPLKRGTMYGLQVMERNLVHEARIDSDEV